MLFKDIHFFCLMSFASYYCRMCNYRMCQLKPPIQHCTMYSCLIRWQCNTTLASWSCASTDSFMKPHVLYSINSYLPVYIEQKQVKVMVWCDLEKFKDHFHLYLWFYYLDQLLFNYTRHNLAAALMKMNTSWMSCDLNFFY